MIDTARIGTELLVRKSDGTAKLLRYDESIENKTLISHTGRICSWHGSVILCNYPVAGAFFINQPVLVPESGFLPSPANDGTTSYSDAHPRNGLVFTLDNSSNVFGAHPFQNSLMVYGNASSAVISLGSPPAQKTVGVGCLNDHAWAGGERVGYWIGTDKNLWTINEKGVQNIGYGWIFKDYSRAHLWYVEETADLFIVLDKNTTGALSEAKMYWFMQGLAEMDNIYLHPAYHPTDGLLALDTDGNLVSFNLPKQASTIEYDWDDFSYSFPTRGPDFVTSWADFKTGNLKSITGLECATTPVHPIYVQIEAMAPPSTTVTTKQFVITAKNPVGEVFIEGARFRFKLWFATYEDAGAMRISQFRVHVNGDDLRGIYAAAEGSFI
jgi:hypothetical protein